MHVRAMPEDSPNRRNVLRTLRGASLRPDLHSNSEGTRMDTTGLHDKIRSLRTTILGTLTILGATFTIASEWIATGVMPSEDKLELFTGALVMGLGLIFSADAKALKKVDAKVNELEK